MNGEDSLMLLVPKSAFADFRELVVPPDVPPHSTVRLKIVVENRQVVAREFASYLQIIDRTYGRFERESLLSYALARSEHLKISRIRSGSLELLLEALASNSKEVTVIVIVGFFLKYLPDIFRAAGSGFKEFQEGFMLREQRRQLHEKARLDKELSSLNDRRRRQLVALLDALCEREWRRLPAARRFARAFVKEVTFEIVDRAGEKAAQENERDVDSDV